MHKRWSYHALLALPLQVDRFFVAPCNELAKYFYMGAQCTSTVHVVFTTCFVVILFFNLASKSSKWCAQTLHPFSQIFKVFSGIRAPIVAPPSDNFQNCLIGWKVLCFRKKVVQTPSKSAYKCRCWK